MEDSFFHYKEEKKMLDIKLLRENPEVVKENIKKKFQDHKLPLVDEVIELDKNYRAARQKLMKCVRRETQHQKKSVCS